MLLESYEAVKLVVSFTNALSFAVRLVAPSIFSMISSFLDSPGHWCIVGETEVVGILSIVGDFVTLSVSLCLLFSGAS